MKITHFPLIFILFCGCDCIRKKEEPTPTKPELTTDGRNTFYCEINCVPYHQKFVGGQPSFPKIRGGYSFIDTEHHLALDIDYNTKEYDFFISFRTITPNTNEVIKLSPHDKSYAYYANKKSRCNYFQSIVKHKTYYGEIKFTRYDPINYIFSGTFEFKNWLPDSIKGTCDTVKVTNGIFDLKL